VGRGAEKSYCILLSGQKLGNDARERIRILTSTNNGFLIAEKDLELRGPGDIEGTRQSGMLNFRLASIVQDRPLLEIARNLAANILDKDPDLGSAGNLPLKKFLQQPGQKVVWSKIS
jgi:ATP-dependent DNA helicase RecG